MWKMLYNGAGHRWQYGACALDAGYLRLQTHTHNTKYVLLLHSNYGYTNARLRCDIRRARVSLDFRSCAAEVFTRLGYGVIWLDDWHRTFRESVVVSSSVMERLIKNSVSKRLELSSDTALYPRQAKTCKSTGLSKKMDGIWNRYNLKSTGRIYTFGILKCSEKFKVLDLP